MRIARKRNYPYIILIEINLRRLLALIVLGLFIFGCVAIVRSCRNSSDDDLPEDAIEVLEPLPEGNVVAYYSKKLNYKSAFNDINETHLEAARSVGLKECPESRADIEKSPEGLVLIESNKWFKVDSLTHSVPYLTAASAGVLTGISKAFRDSLSSHDFPQYRVIVTSVLRTKADVKKLRRNNVNATEDSAHCYGTTFDLSYVHYDKVQEGGDYMQPYDLTKLLSEVLRDFKDAGDIYVKYEVKQHCFHITSRR